MKKVAIVTGASSGIGLACAKRLCQMGFTVYGISRKPIAEEFESFACNVNDSEGIKKIFDTIFEKEGQIDVLVNNAGFGIAGAIADTKLENISAIVDTNLTALIKLCSLIIPHLKASGGGKIINISSVAGIVPLPFQACYSATKAGVEIFSRALATEVRKDNIKIVAVLPGDTKTGFTSARIVDDKEGSAYSQRMKNSVGKMEKDEQHGKSPDYVAKVICKMIQKKNPPLRVSVGGLSKLEVFLARTFPSKFVNFIVRKIYDK